MPEISYDAIRVRALNNHPTSTDVMVLLSRITDIHSALDELRAEHQTEYRSVADEVYQRNAGCTCGAVVYPCDTGQILDRIS